jgi:molecular chaperone Hsp33
VSFLIVDFQAPDRLRAYARYDAKRLEEGQDSGALLGKGHLAMTIDQGPDMSSYQGLVALDGGRLEDAAHEYFLRSEQIPTRVRLAVGEEWRGGGGGPKHRWRAGGVLLQFLPKAPERARQADLHPGDAPEGVLPHGWRDTPDRRPVADSTVEDIERSIRICPASGCSSFVPRARRSRVRAAARAQCLVARRGVGDAEELRT